MHILFSAQGPARCISPLPSREAASAQLAQLSPRNASALTIFLGDSSESLTKRLKPILLSPSTTSIWFPMKTCLMEDRARATWKDPREPSYALAPGGSWTQVPHLILFFGVEAPAKNAASSVSVLSRLAISSLARAILSSMHMGYSAATARS